MAAVLVRLGSPTDFGTVAEGLDRLELAVTALVDRSAASSVAAARLHAALDALPCGIVVADRHGEVVLRNPVASAFVDARHGDALVESAIGELIEASLGGKGSTRRLDLFGPPRRVLDLRVVPLVRRPGDGPHGPRRPVVLGALVVIDDISERQRLDAVRRDFVANISHELKTPVGALGVLAETLAGEDDPDVVSRLAERMQQEAFRVARTIDDLLQLSQIEAGELPSRDPVPVHLVLAEAVDRTRAAAEMQGVTLHVDEPSPRLTVVGDRRQLVSALANLCDNAVKYSDRDGAVRLSARTDGTWVEIDVADEGIGIPGADLERVFERFYRVDRARSRDTGGTGLGLAIVRHVVQNHEGSVTVRSREGEGSTFTLRLPAGPGPVSLSEPAPPRKAAG